MKKKWITVRTFACLTVTLLLAVAFHPALNPFWNNDFIFDGDLSFKSIGTVSADELPLQYGTSTRRNSVSVNVTELIRVTEDHTDTDNDKLPDTVEAVIGTDYNNSDTDFDNLDDYYETFNGLDPLKPDSNDDGLSDNFEVSNVTLDLDKDGIDNAWDIDNDGDGVSDSQDMAPFCRSNTNDQFHFDIVTKGNPTYINFQIRPDDSSHLFLPLQGWDWPEDDQGMMKDLNNSKDDVTIMPYLELTIPCDFTIISEYSGKCLAILNESYLENASIYQTSYSGKDSQRWRVEAVEEGYFKIQAKHSGMCLEVNHSIINGSHRVQQGIFTGMDTQLWKMYPGENNSYSLQSKAYALCLEVTNVSSENETSVGVGECTDEDHQFWKIEPLGNTVPSQNEVAMYGVFSQLNKTYIPLVPVWELGRIVAFSGKMFYPVSSPLNLAADARLLWMVNGKTDTQLRGLQAYNMHYVSLQNDSITFQASDDVVGEQSTFEWIDLGQDRVALQACNGYYVGLTTKQGGGSSSSSGIDMLADTYNLLTANSSEIGDRETFELVYLDQYTAGLKACNGLFVSCTYPYSPGNLTATSTSMETGAVFTLTDLGYTSDTIILAKYYEDFMFTGFNIQENYGSEIGLFYSTDTNQTLRAGVVLAYEFLRSQKLLSDMPSYLENLNVVVNSTLYLNSTHQDEGTIHLMSKMYPQALHELHHATPHAILPVITTIEERFTMIAMDELHPGNLVVGTRFSANLSSFPVVTMKIFKMNWHNTTSMIPLASEDVLLHVMKWGLAKGFNESDGALLSMMGLCFSWNLGEFKITQRGDIPTEFTLPELPLVLDIVQNYIYFPTVAIIDLTLAITGTSLCLEYRFLKWIGKLLRPLLKPIGTAIKAGLKALKLGGLTTKILKALKSCQKAVTAARGTRFVQILDKASKYLILLDLVITGVIAFYMFWDILWKEGGSTFGALMGTWVVILSFAYAAIYILIGLALPVIGIILAILDMIFDFFGKFLNWILGCLTKTKIRSEFDLGFEGSPSIDLHDYDNNGVDVGDRIEFMARVWGKVWRTGHGSMGDLTASYVNPSLTLSSATLPEETEWGSYKTKISTETDDQTYRTETYELGVWADPISMHNFPLPVQLSYSYRRYYDKCIWFFGWWCSRDDDSGTQTADITTLYFDVLPGNLTSFLAWNELTPLDTDGDGLHDSKELLLTANPWRYDTDGDGLCDKYEIDFDTLPFKADTDDDGLSDGIEDRYGTNANNSDTDADGLSDYEEYSGWTIELTYCGTSFTLKATSDPLKQDSDDDGLSDLEEYMRGLNPRSKDTNGNNINDEQERPPVSQGFIRQIDFNGKGSSIRVQPGASVNTTVAYRIFGEQCPVTEMPSNCTLTVFLEEVTTGNHSSDTVIYYGTPDVYNLTENITVFSFNASTNETFYVMKYLINWTCDGTFHITNPDDIIGFVDVNVTITESLQWECYAPGQDTDSDDITDLNEAIGWPVQYTDEYGMHTVHVTSDPRRMDTDDDGLPDVWEHNCFENSTNPRDPDTDHDGLTDPYEILQGTNPLFSDTDGEGLDDQHEITFKSDPLDNDTDDDGLNDYQEYLLHSNPNDPDTDHDGLSDIEEYLFNSSLSLPDTDSDTLFDRQEYLLDTDPRDKDTDHDGLIDGYEVLVGTLPTNPDTDNDTLWDNDELYWITDPLVNDTDQDGLFDGGELQYGSHPLVGDTDRDGINDSEDLDTFAPHVDHIILAYDLDEDVLDFKEHLEMYTAVTTVSVDELLSNPTYKTASSLVLIGRLDAGEGTVGNISRHILETTGENTSMILDTDSDFFTVKYGVWNKTQTIVMLAHPYRLDHLLVLNLLKTMRKTINGSTVEVEFPTPRRHFQIDTIDEIDTLLSVDLIQSAIPWVQLTRHTTSTIPIRLTYTTGLPSKEFAVGKYLELRIGDTIQNDTDSLIENAWVILYYTSKDLDRNGDGDADDVDDIDEKTLVPYYFDESSGTWKKVSKTMTWVSDVGVDTTDIQFNSKNYGGYVWMKVSHFSFYTLAGNPLPPTGKKTYPPPPAYTNPTADASASETEGYINTAVLFNGSRSTDDGAIVSWSWQFGDGSTGSGEVTSHVYTEQGMYTVKLTVVDNVGLTDTDVIEVVIAQPNRVPLMPHVDGPTEGMIHESYAFTIVSTDPDNDTLCYHIDWGDDTNSSSVFVDSGSTIILNHTWVNQGVYFISVYSEDSNGGVSGSADVVMSIDVQTTPVQGLLEGYFVDRNNDGVYDSFIDNATRKECLIQQQTDGMYLIDIDNNGVWDFSYDPLSQTFTEIEAAVTDYTTVIVIILAVIFLLICFVVIVVLRSRKKKK